MVSKIKETVGARSLFLLTKTYKGCRKAGRGTARKSLENYPHFEYPQSEQITQPS
jgi:hypothetical protein